MRRAEIFFVSHDSAINTSATQEFHDCGLEISCVTFLPEEPKFFDIIILPADVFLRLEKLLSYVRYITYGDKALLRFCFFKGASDFLSTPLDITEMLYRTQNLLQKNHKTVSSFGILEAQTFTFSDISIHLSPEEEKVLEILLSQKGHAINQNTISQILKEDFSLPPKDSSSIQKISSRNVDMKVSALRKKFKAFSSLPYLPIISTYYGKGYIFDIVQNKYNLQV